VSLASIQALYRMAMARESEIAELRRENAALIQRLAELEALVRQIGRTYKLGSDNKQTP
jgi:hypothetical protein